MRLSVIIRLRFLPYNQVNDIRRDVIHYTNVNLIFDVFNLMFNVTL